MVVANEKLNLTMLCDFYELTMGSGYFEKGYKDRICYFDVFFRQCPDGGGFAIAAGLEQVVSISRICISARRISTICGDGRFSARNSWNIWQISALPVISGRCLRERPFSPRSPS